MEGLSELLAFLKDNTTTSSQVIIIVFVLVVFLAGRLFSKEAPWKLRAVVFGVCVFLGGGAVVLVHLAAHDAADRGEGTVPPPIDSHSRLAPDGGLRLAALERVQQHPPRRGWIYLGEYDRAQRRWGADRQVDLPEGRPQAIPPVGSVIRSSSKLSLYDRPPRYTLFGFRWTLGRSIGTIESGTRLRVLNPVRFAGNRAWCDVEILPPGPPSGDPV